MDNELDLVLGVVANSVRRRIIKRLSQESSYPLELSNYLGLNQQLVSKHLKVMEESEIVDTGKESSPFGPSRRIYSLNKEISLALNVAPDLYSAKVSFANAKLLKQKTQRGREIEDELQSALMKESRSIEPYAKLISEVDKQIDELDQEREDLIKLRNRIMREAKENIQEKNISIGERMIIYHYLDRNEKNIKKISKNLELREERVSYLIKKLKDESILQ